MEGSVSNIFAKLKNIEVVFAKLDFENLATNKSTNPICEIDFQILDKISSYLLNIEITNTVCNNSGIPIISIKTISSFSIILSEIDFEVVSKNTALAFFIDLTLQAVAHNCGDWAQNTVATDFVGMSIFSTINVEYMEFIVKDRLYWYDNSL